MSRATPLSTNAQRSIGPHTHTRAGPTRLTCQQAQRQVCVHRQHTQHSSNTPYKERNSPKTATEMHAHSTSSQHHRHATLTDRHPCPDANTELSSQRPRSPLSLGSQSTNASSLPVLTVNTSRYKRKVRAESLRHRQLPLPHPRTSPVLRATSLDSHWWSGWEALSLSQAGAGVEKCE